ncbi:hypothetical protein [Terribacillus saccharophilus]|uniref:hypothetical protein n=1 Tax=Terribacillus saccharophilus TaxID=361277 RepID=UPI003982854E
MRWFVLVILLTGCSYQEPVSNKCQQQMTGYLDITEDNLYIIPKNEEIRYKLNGVAIPGTIQNGEEITVTYTSILESYPPQLTVCKMQSR